jgi:hypothetical protein
LSLLGGCHSEILADASKGGKDYRIAKKEKAQTGEQQHPDECVRRLRDLFWRGKRKWPSRFLSMAII